MLVHSFTPLLRLRAVCKRFDAGAGRCAARVRALDDVHLEVAGGEIVQLRGRIGAGKSTLLLCAAGLLLPDRGDVAWRSDAAASRDCEGICFLATGALSDHELLAPRLDDAESAWLVLIDSPPADDRCVYRDLAASIATRAAAAGAAVIVATRPETSAPLRADRIVDLSAGRIVGGAPRPAHIPDADRVAEPWRLSRK